MKKLMLLLWVVSLSAMAHGHHDPVVNNYYTTNTTSNFNYSDSAACGIDAVSLSAATIQFDLGTDSLQWGAGGAKVDSNCGGMFFGLGMRLGENRLLLNGGFGVYDGMDNLHDAPFNFGVSGKF